MVIKQVFFNHRGGKYVYRMHTEKIRKLCTGKFNAVKEYLYEMLESCPSEYFNDGPRGSCLRFNLVDNTVIVTGHGVSVLAKYGLEVNRERFSDAHSRIQSFMLENDNNTLAMEVPIWLLPKEFAGYKALFKSDGVLTGHIDILRIEDGKIWVWDYKPNAKNERYATTQTFFYAYMLHRRTGIPLEKFRCGYFDHYYAFIYKPSKEFLLKLQKQRLLI